MQNVTCECGYELGTCYRCARNYGAKLIKKQDVTIILANGENLNGFGSYGDAIAWLNSLHNPPKIKGIYRGKKQIFH